MSVKLNVPLGWWGSWKDNVRMAKHLHDKGLDSKGWCNAAMLAQMNYVCFSALYFAEEK